MNTHIHPFLGTVSLADRHCLNRHRSALLWFTGLSGSGKSTLAHAVEQRLYDMGVRSYVLDGDNIRTGLNSDLGLCPKDRRENIRRIAHVARLMVDAGLLVFASFIAPYRESRAFVREQMSGFPYYECYVKCDLEVCKDRDPKGLYQKALAGEITNMTGLTAPYEEPLAPDLVIETDRLPLEGSVDAVLDFLIRLQIVQPKPLSDAPTIVS